MSSNRTIERLLRQQAALAHFGSFAFKETDLEKVLSEAARICPPIRRRQSAQYFKDNFQFFEQRNRCQCPCRPYGA